MTAKVLAIGLDAADWSYLNGLWAKGLCPNLAALARNGGTGRLTKPPSWADDAVWSSFALGAPLGAHGRYHGPFQYDPATYRPVLFRDRPQSTPPFWADLDARGLRCGVLDVPKCPLAREMDHGFQIADWLVHARDWPHAVSTPDPLAREIVARFGEPPPSPCRTYTFGRGIPYHAGFSDAEALGWTDALKTSVEMKAAASAHLLAQSDWDLFVTVFKELHCAGHLFWDDADPDHPEHDADRADRRGHPVTAIYADIDAELPRLIEAAGPGAICVVFSPHGMQPNYSMTPALEPLVDAYNAAIDQDRVLGRLRRVVSDRLRGPEAAMTCLAVHHNELGGAIRVNLQGREAQGRVAPGTTFDRVCAEMTEILLDLHDPSSGRRVVREVVAPQHQDVGPKAEALPDLLALWQEEVPITSVRSSRFGDLPLDPRRVRPGNHNGAGFFLQSGGAMPDADIPIEALAAHLTSLLDAHSV